MSDAWIGDLGGTGFPRISENTLPDWYTQYQLYSDWFRYYSGVILEDRAEQTGQENPVLLYPVKMNLVKLMCHTQADSLWGEWEDRLFHLQMFPKVDEVSPDAIQALSRYLYSIFDDNGIEPRLWECGLDMMRYGGAVLRLSKDPKQLSGIRIERVPVTAFYPIWSPDSFDRLLEVFIVTQIPAISAQKYFGVDVRGSQGDSVLRVEHWTLTHYENTIDGKRVERFSGRHSFKRIPFFYIPRLRSDSFYGESLTKDVVGAQDELNMRVADVGEAITYNAHPIKYGYNLPRDINDPNKFPYSPDKLWNLGNHLPGADPPTINVLEAENPVPDVTMSHIRFIYDWARAASYSPPVAFGEDEGSQRSGTTLVLRMWPLTRAVRRSRLYIKPALIRLIDTMVDMATTNGNKSMPAALRKTYEQVMMDIDFAPVLPRERAELVNEVVMRAQTEPASISREGAMEFLGVRDPQLELDRLEEQEKEQQERAIEVQKVAMQNQTNQSASNNKPKDKKRSDENRVAN